MSRIRKDVVQIRFEILEYLNYAPKPQLRTYVWRRATTLSYDDFLRHLTYLEERGLINEQDGLLELSEQGRNTYNKLREALPSIL